MTTSAASGLRRDVALVVLVLAWLAVTAWARPLMLPDEGRYAGVAWEMLRSGDWLTPTLDGLPYFHKPPLFYWITAASLQLFGVHALAARAAPLLGAWLGAIALFALVRRWSDERAARLALLALLAQPLFYLGGQYANLDMLVAGCITATIALAAHAVLCAQERQNPRRWVCAAYAMAALGVLAKGLIGGVLPALVLGAWLLWRRDARGLRALLSPIGALLFMAIAAPWFIAMQERHEGFLHYFFVVQHFQRYATAGFNNAQPLWFYAALLLMASLPWWPWLAALLRRAREGMPAKGRSGALRPLMLIWLLVVVVFFSLPRSKLIGYVLPAVPPLCVLIAEGVAASRLPARLARRLWLGGAALGVALSLAVVVALAHWPQRTSRELAAALNAVRTSGDTVVMLGAYAFDVPLLAGLRSPVVVIDAWSDAAIQHRDDWRKELQDAQAFAAPAARGVLQTPEEAVAGLCRSARVWVISAIQKSPPPLLQAARLQMATRELQLWRLDPAEPATASALGCARTPSADPR